MSKHPPKVFVDVRGYRSGAVGSTAWFSKEHATDSSIPYVPEEAVAAITAENTKLTRMVFRLKALVDSPEMLISWDEALGQGASVALLAEGDE